MAQCLVACLFFLLLLPFATPQIQQPGAGQVWISECPGRSVPQLRALATHHDLSLLFYYVSWSSDARQARLVYDGVAHYYSEYANFGAIDCWHMQCNCSHTHRPAHGVGGGYPDKWPTLIVRYGSQLQLQYHGSWHFEDLTRFMNHLIQPLDRVHSSNELSALRRVSDAVVLALLDSADSQAYKRFVAAAVRWLELDPERNIRYTVTFGASARQMLKTENITLPQLIVIDNRNRVHSYNASRTSHWQTLDILHWVRHTLKGMALLADGYGSPMTIALKARRMPVLAMGLSRHQTADQSLFMAEELAQQQEHTACREQWLPEYQDSRQDGDYSLLPMPVELFVAGQQSQLQLTSHCYRSWQLNAATLANYYRINSYLNYRWTQQVHQSHHHRLPQLLALHSRNRCLLSHAEQDTPALRIAIAKIVTKYGQLMWLNSAEQPTQNRSLAVVLFDAHKYRDYLQQLNIEQQQQQPQVFILDVAQESLHLMSQPFSYVALKEFIRLFYAGQLPRLQRNALATPTEHASLAPYMHAYNRQLLLQALQRSNLTNVVLMYRPDCALSMVLSQTLVQVAALLRSPELQFIRFDSQANDLPWELSMPESPALLVFPQSRPLESLLFPSEAKPSVQNVFAFILSQLEPEQQLRLVLASCRRRMRHVTSCLDFARSLVLQHVSQYLKYWEIFEKERDLILEHLKQFNDIHIAIESSIRL